MTPLEVPYRSQWNRTDANRYSGDCGPTCVAMVLNYKQISITPNAIYDFIPQPHRERGITDIIELQSVVRRHQVPANRRQYLDAADALNNLRANLDAGNPLIVLVKYIHWRPTTGNQYDKGHFVVATGYDDNNIYMHDPLFGAWVKPPEKGAHYAMPHALFCAGWGGFIDKKLNWICCVVGDGVAQPQTSTAVAPPPAPAPTPQPVPTELSMGELSMHDVNRRIRALAAYRHAEAPDFNDPAAVQLWLDHLGDWGFTYDEYVVQNGDMLSALASRFYGDSSRWHAIQAYNDLQENGFILVGETLFIPRLGQSGAHTTTALPSNTTGFGKEIDLENLVDPDLLAFDYNAGEDESLELGYGRDSS